LPPFFAVKHMPQVSTFSGQGVSLIPPITGRL
jgi:hypothetical protein